MISPAVIKRALAAALQPELSHGVPTVTGRQLNERTGTLVHYTAPDRVESLLAQGYDFDQPSIHTVSGHRKVSPEEAKENRFGGEVGTVPLTTAGSRWKQRSEPRAYYDYDKQEWVDNPNPQTLELVPVPAVLGDEDPYLYLGEMPGAISERLGVPYQGLSRFLREPVLRDHFAGVVVDRAQGRPWTQPDNRPTKYGEADWFNYLTGGLDPLDTHVFTHRLFYEDPYSGGASQMTPNALDMVHRKLKRPPQIVRAEALPPRIQWGKRALAPEEEALLIALRRGE